MKEWTRITSSRELSLMIHDRKCEYCHFNYESKEMDIQLSSEIGDKHDVIHLKFSNVYCYEMIACDFWAPSPHVFDGTIISNRSGMLYQRVMKEIKANDYIFARLENNAECIEVQIQYSSGDLLTILCDMVRVR